MGLGCGCGAIIGAICNNLSRFTNDEIYHDRTLFEAKDNISYGVKN